MSILGLELLRFVSEKGPQVTLSPEVDAADEREIDWLLRAGLGPLLYWAAGGDRAAWTNTARRDLLKASDMVARVRHSRILDVALEVVAACRSVGEDPILLKGISTSEEVYPSGHLRPMGDVDILVRSEGQALVERALLQLDYVPMSDYEVAPKARHGVPLRHPSLGVWVEIHSDLFENNAREGTIGCERARRESARSELAGQPVRRMAPELQIIHTAHAWMMDVSRRAIQVDPSGLPALFDSLLLLKRFGDRLRERVLVERQDNQVALACAYSVVSYLARRCPSLAAAHTTEWLRRSQRLIGPIHLRGTHVMIERFFLAGTPWHLPFPPPVPGRYSVRHQWGKLAWVFPSSLIATTEHRATFERKP